MEITRDSGNAKLRRSRFESRDRDAGFLIPGLILALLAATLAGCEPGSRPASKQALDLAAQRDAAAARADLLEQENRELKKAQLQLTAEKETAAEEADTLILSLMGEVSRHQRVIDQLTERLDAMPREDYADIIRLQDGQEVVCKILDLQGNTAEVQLPNGTRKKARLTDIERILLRVTGDFAVGPDMRGVDPVVKAPVVEPGGDRRMELSPFWNIKLPASSRTIEALHQILRPYGKPRLDQTGRTGATLFQDIYYLMPLEAAQAALGQSVVQRNEIQVPGLPKSSFFSYEYTGLFEEKFNRLLLVTDNVGQAVAVQLAEDSPPGPWLDPNNPTPYSEVYSESLDLFNIMENRKKSIAKGLVGCRVTRLGPDVLRVDSELLGSQRTSKTCVRLYIAQPVVDLILYLIETRY